MAGVRRQPDAVIDSRDRLLGVRMALLQRKLTASPSSRGDHRGRLGDTQPGAIQLYRRIGGRHSRARPLSATSQPGWLPCRRCGRLLEVRRTLKLVCSQCKAELRRTGRLT